MALNMCGTCRRLPQVIKEMVIWRRWMMIEDLSRVLMIRTIPACSHGAFPAYSITQVSAYSTSRRPNFFSQLIENIKTEMARNKEMKESLKKFREEAEKLEQSDAIQKARKKYQSVEQEASRGSEIIRERVDAIRGKMQEAVEEAGKSELARKAGQLTGELGKQAKEAADSIAEQSQKISKSGAFQAISQTAEVVKKELNVADALGARIYRPPMKLRKRLEQVEESEKRVFSADTETTGVELHKDSRFFQSWQSFKDNNQYVHKIIDWKMKYDESNNPVVRASRLLTEKVSDMMGGLFQKTELSEALTEICKMDHNFDKHRFLKECETDIIPNILEAIVRGDLEILRDWCHEAPFSVLATPIRQAQSLGYILDSQIIDIDNVDLAMGKMMEQGPVLVISFTSQQIMCVRDRKNNVIEGDLNKVMRVQYVWVLCRDQTELNPRAAWRLLDLSANSTEQLL